MLKVIDSVLALNFHDKQILARVLSESIEKDRVHQLFIQREEDESLALMQALEDNGMNLKPPRVTSDKLPKVTSDGLEGWLGELYPKYARFTHTIEREFAEFVKNNSGKSFHKEEIVLAVWRQLKTHGLERSKYSIMKRLGKLKNDFKIVSHRDPNSPKIFLWNIP